MRVLELSLTLGNIFEDCSGINRALRGRTSPSPANFWLFSSPFII